MVKRVSAEQIGVLGSDLTHFYDLSDNIGPLKGAYPNNADDVALVQFFLDDFFFSHPKRPLGKLAIDGVFGPMTHYWCLYFLAMFEDEKAKNLRDKYNFFVAARGFQANSAKNTLIFQLNRSFNNRHPGGFAKLETENPKFPALVKAKLARRDARDPSSSDYKAPSDIDRRLRG